MKTGLWAVGALISVNLIAFPNSVTRVNFLGVKAESPGINVALVADSEVQQPYPVFLACDPVGGSRSEAVTVLAIIVHTVLIPSKERTMN